MSASRVTAPVKLPLELWRRLQREARRQHRSTSAVINQAVLRDLQAEPVAQPRPRKSRRA